MSIIAKVEGKPLTTVW